MLRNRTENPTHEGTGLEGHNLHPPASSGINELWHRLQKKKYSYTHGRGRAFIHRCYQIQHRLEMIERGHKEYRKWNFQS